MTQPITLFTGQWADLPLDNVARLAAEWGYDGLELACSGDHLDLERADQDDAYLNSRRDILDRHGLALFAISNHLTGQAVCDDPIDFRHQAIVRSSTWGDGDPEGVRQRAAEDMKRAARVAGKLGVDTVIGFTGSKIWPYVAQFPPVPAWVIDAGYQDFADRWNPILDVFDQEGVRFAHEVHPSEIAYDYWTSVRTLEAIGHREAFGFNWDPSRMMWQDMTRSDSSSTSPTASITSTARTPVCARSRDEPAGSDPTCPGATRAEAGTSYPPGTATCPGRTPSEPSTPSATPGPSPSSGRTQAWTDSTERARPSTTCAPPSGPAPRTPSILPSPTSSRGPTCPSRLPTRRARRHTAPTSVLKGSP